MNTPKRTYQIIRYYMVQCSECAEDITVDSEFAYTLADARDHRDKHEEWHREHDNR